MGGNVKVKGIQAQKIPVKEIGLKKFQDDIKTLLKQLNKMFYKEYHKYIWENEEILDNSYVFNGSTSYLMDGNYLDNEKLLDLKPTAGDIDVMVPEDLKKDLWVFLKLIENKKIKNFIYIGNNKETVTSINDQINALFEYDYKNGKVYTQIDFEFVPFENNIPTEWSKFSHSSTFKDLEAGVKAVFHKYLIRSIAHSVSIMGNVVFATKASNCEKLRISKSKKSNHFLKFSVSKGIRVAFEPMICNGEQVYYDGKSVYKELPTDISIYETEIKNIFKMLFGKESSKSEEEKMWSFVGLLDLMKTYLDKKEYELNIVDKIALNFLGYPQSGWIDLKSISMTKADFLYKLTTSKAALKKIILIPGETYYYFLKDISKILDISEDKLFDAYYKYRYKKDGNILAQTYSLPIGMDEDELIKYLINYTNSKYEEFSNKIFGLYKKQNWFKYIIVASIIQKEAASVEEMPIVASVIYNRLKKKMKLQMDGTLNYGKYSHIRITPKRIREDMSLYNTYKYKGIPKYPVCNVSLEAIMAAVFPAKTNYLYFMKSKNGTHDFSSNYSTHLRHIKNATK